ncbi:hypothetical protein DYH09_33395 [bacterium CPR1]|nr:hypothetical protein [bacterium CPR1]
MKPSSLSLFFGLLLFLPARADIEIEQLLVRMRGEDVNIRVTIRNPGANRQAGPVMIDLYVRDDASSPWEKVRTWNDIAFVQPGYRVSRDFFEENNARLRALAADHQFEAKAVVRVPGGVKDVEAVRAYEQE